MMFEFVWEFRGAGLSIFGPVCSCRRRVTSEQHSCHREFRSASAQVRASLESLFVLRVWIGSGNPQLVMRVWIGSGGVFVSMRTWSVYGTCSFACTGHGVLVTSGAVVASLMVSMS